MSSEAPKMESEAEKPSPAPQRPTIKKTATKTMSIPTDLNALKEVVNKPKEEITIDEADEVDIRNTPYTKEEFKVQWDAFVNSGKLQKLEQELLSTPYELENHEVVVSIPNEALTVGFEKFRSDLLQHLRDSLKNDHITLKSKVVELEKEKMLYTDREKFTYLKEKYPALKELQEKLGLDPEF